MKKYNPIIVALNGGAVFLILNYGGVYKWGVLTIFTLIQLFIYYFFYSKNKKL